MLGKAARAIEKETKWAVTILLQVILLDKNIMPSVLELLEEKHVYRWG